MRILVVSQFGRPLAAPIGTAFDAHGGIIGRSPDCRLVLPDPNRHISRQQARIEQVGNDFFITCIGSANSIVVAGRELAGGERTRLSHGDVLVIGEYEMRVEMAGDTGARASAPFDDAFDPFAEFDVGGGESGSAADAQPDADPFATPPGGHPFEAAQAPPDPRDPLGLGEARRGMPEFAQSSESIDALFGLNRPGVDPLAPASSLAAGHGDAGAAPVDPFGGLLGHARVSSPPAADPGSGLSAAMSPPEAIPPTDFGLGPLEPESPPTRELPALHDDRKEPFLSWRESRSKAALPERDARGERARGAAPQARAGASLPARSAAAAQPRGPAAQASAARPAAPVTPPASAVPQRATSNDELLQALLDGLGVDALPAVPLGGAQPLRHLTPELMRQIGEVLRVASEGTVRLLQARTTLKRELQAELTFIASSDNNPLKFSPDGLAALPYLLSPRAARGFMDAVSALRDAHDDLLAHEIAMVAGMRAAMQELIARFNPARLESRLADKSVLDALLPSARDARLWSIFQDVFAQISREAEDDFEKFFGREFVRAYEAQIARIGKRGS